MRCCTLAATRSSSAGCTRRLHTRSAAAVRIVRRLDGPAVLSWLEVVLPRPACDALYDVVARNRYRWFGRRDTCMTPTPEMADRFLGS